MELIVITISIIAIISIVIVICLIISKSKERHLRNEVDKIQKKYPLACKTFLTKNRLSVKNANIKTLKKIVQRSEAIWKKEENSLQNQEDEKNRKAEEQQRSVAKEKQRRQEESSYAVVVKEEENVPRGQEGGISQEEMQRLLQLSESRKKDWEQYKKVLCDNVIHHFYHFTDERNLQSIKECGGLLSMAYCNEHDITIPRPGGSDTSWSLDYRLGLADYVRLSFTDDHPMMHIAMNDGRISSPALLEVSLDVAYIETTLFANKNAARTNDPGNIGGGLIDLQHIHFNTVKHPKYFDLIDEEKPFYQAEILVKTFVPMKYIKIIDPMIYSLRLEMKKMRGRGPYFRRNITNLPFSR